MKISLIIINFVVTAYYARLENFLYFDWKWIKQNGNFNLLTDDKIYGFFPESAKDEIKNPPVLLNSKQKFPCMHFIKGSSSNTECVLAIITMTNTRTAQRANFIMPLSV